MTRIDIGSLTDPEENAWYTLNDGTMPEALLGTLYDPVMQEGESAREMLRLGLRGTPTQMRAVVERLERYAQRARRSSQEGVGSPLYLRVRSADDGSFYYSRLLSARFASPTAGLAHFEGGSLSLDFEIIRENHFDGQEIALPLSNTSSAGTTSGLTLYNHDDSDPGNDNYFSVDTSMLGLSLPAPMRVEITNLATADLADFFISSLALDAGSSLPTLSYEAENGSGGTAISLPTYRSNNAYASYSWTNAGWTSLAAWEVTSAALFACGNHWFLPMIFFYPGVSIAGLQYRLRLTGGGLTLYLGPASAHSAGFGYGRLAPLRLPVGGLPLTAGASPLTLSLEVYTPQAGSYTLDIDMLYLFPQDGFTFYHAVGALATNDKLVDDAFTGKVYSLKSGLESFTHQRLGQQLLLRGAGRQLFYIFATASTNLAGINRTCSVKAWCRKRRQLP